MGIQQTTIMKPTKKQISKGIIGLVTYGVRTENLVIYVSPKRLKELIPKGYKSITSRDVLVKSIPEIPNDYCYILDLSTVVEDKE